MLTEYSNSRDDFKPGVLMLLSNPATYDTRPVKEALSLANNGYKVILLAWDREGGAPKHSFISKNLVIQRFKLRAPYGQNMRTLLGFALFYIWCFINSVMKHFQVIHCHDVDTLLCGILLKIPRWSRVKLVYDMHDHPVMFLSKFPKSEILINLIFTFTRSYFDHLVVVNEGFVKYLSRRGFKKGNLTVIMNVPETVVGRPQLRENGVFRIFYYGSLSRVRGVHNLINAVSPLSNVLLLLAGKGELVSLITKLERTHTNISYLGWLSPSELDSFIRASNLILSLSSLYSPNNINHILATPEKFFTSLAHGIPVLVSEGTYQATLARRYGCGLIVDMKNISDIREVIEILVKDKELYNRLARNGLKIARERFNWKIMEKRLVSLYESLNRRTIS